MDFTLNRPDTQDHNILLCIPAAFTDLKDFRVDGFYICNSREGDQGRINKTLGGGIIISHGDCRIFPTQKGKLINDSLISVIKQEKGSFFQQIQCITNGIAANYIDKKVFQRRGIARFRNQKTAIVESHTAITLKQFSDDLAGLGATDLLYTDMGAWDEGWYRNGNGKTVTMGSDLTQTKRQSNWVVFCKQKK